MQAFTKQTLTTFWKHATKYRVHVAVLIVGVVGVTAAQTYIPLLYRDLIDTLATASSREKPSLAFHLVVIILIVNATKLLWWRAVNFVNNYFQPKVMSDLTNSCYQYLQQHSYGFFTSSFVGSLVTKVKRYERAFEQIADQIVYELGRSFLDTGMVLFVLLWQYRTIGMLVLAWSLFFLAFSYFYSRFKLPWDIKKAAADTQTTAQLADSITNNTNVKLFTNYDLEKQRFHEVTKNQFLLRKKSWDLGTIGDGTQGLLMVGLEFLIIYLALRLWQQQLFSVGDIALLQAYLLRIFDKLWNTGKNIRNIYEAIADANEMTEILSAPHGVQDVPSAQPLTVSKGRVEFRDVSFGYTQELPILKNFNLTVSPGERVAFIGPSGGGKSTIVKLLLRLYDVNKGDILVDNQNIAQVTQNSLRASMALVPQDPILFHRSLMENIRYANHHATDDEVVEVAKRAHAHEFISSFPQGYSTLVGERGMKLSGGERQRVAIARARLKNAPILILDEATSSLDSESELYIQDALKKLMEGRTTIVISHRLSTIKQMDRIVVIEGGKIIEEGTHQKLLEIEQGVYQKLWEIQVGGFQAPQGATG
ncbi:MAG: ABC transporter ATP-binding protein [Parcubacteria group bacterium]|nr:ABC transporter ATP-binding protein [Parcubacteria group bacterium]